MDKSWRYSRIGIALLAAAFFILSYDLATASAGYLPELFVIIIAVYLTLGLCVRWLKLSRFWKHLINSKMLTLAALCYLLADIINAACAPAADIVIQKYKVVCGLIIISCAVLFVAFTKSRLDVLLISLGASAAAASVATLLNYRWPVFFQMYYHLRLSPRVDYNMFATALTTGLICGGCAIITSRAKISPILRGTALFILASAVLPSIYLSGSRRAFLLFAPVAAMLCFFYLSESGPIERAGRILSKRAAYLSFIAVVCFFSVTGAQALMHSSLVNTAPGKKSYASASAETSALERYQMTDPELLLSKRSVIYQIALEEIAAYDKRELMLGRGLGANIQLYDRNDPRILSAYPDDEKRIGNLSAHNMLLADMLDGGAIKVAALLFLLCAAAYEVLMLLWNDVRRGIPYAMALSLAVIGSLVSNRFGLLYDRYFVLLISMLIMERGWHNEKNSDAQHAAQL